MGHYTPKMDTAEKWRRGLLRMLTPYVSGDDVSLDHDTFLQFVADRINDDLKSRRLPCRVTPD